MLYLISYMYASNAILHNQSTYVMFYQGERKAENPVETLGFQWIQKEHIRNSTQEIAVSSGLNKGTMEQ